jgi:hypothetical protein
MILTGFSIETKRPAPLFNRQGIMFFTEMSIFINIPKQGTLLPGAGEQGEKLFVVVIDMDYFFNLFYLIIR